MGRLARWLMPFGVAVGGIGLGQDPKTADERTVFGAVGVRQEAQTGLVAGAPGPWQQAYVPGGGYWHRRIAVDITNPGPAVMVDTPLAIPIGGGAGALPLAGTELREIRVCAADGTEFLFGVLDGAGTAVTGGPLRDGYRLVLPAECDPGATRRYLVYAGNPQAWDVPDSFAARIGLANPGFEQGSGAVPGGWTFRGADEQHTLAWERGGSRSGDRCVHMTAVPGATRSWFTATQTGLRATAGGRYTLHGWVKGREIAGPAGLYVHVADATNPQAVNRVEGAGEGTFDWREVSVEFTAPPGATAIALGSVLYGSGDAWYDDLTLELQNALPDAGPRATVGAEERLDLESQGAGAPWPAGPPPPGYRLPLTVRNLTDRPFTGVAFAQVPRLRAHLADGEELAIGPPSQAASERLTSMNLPSSVAFPVSLPAHAERVYYGYALPDRKTAPDVTARGSYRALLDGDWAKVVQNPDLEQGDGAPTGWSTGVETTAGAGLAQSNAADPQVTYGWISPGFVGSKCVRMTVGTDATEAWRGWRQTVAVKPDTTYLYAGWVRTQDIMAGEVRLHCHTLDAAGALCGTKYHGVGTATGQGLTGTNDWALLLGTVRTSADTRSVTLYLTMNARGTVDHDAILFCEVTEASVGEGETNPALLPRDLTLWQANPIAKLFRDHRPGAPLTEVTAAAARNEKESVQLGLLPRRDGTVVLAVQPPVHATGYRLPAVTVERVGYVPVDHVSAWFTADTVGARRVLPQGSPISDGWAGWWPDPLLPVHGALPLSAGRVQPVWLTFSIPEDAPAGEYRGSLSLTGDGSRTEVPIRMTVWDFALPAAPRLTALFDLREGPGWSFLTPDSRRVWLRFLAAHRLCTDQVLPAPTMRIENGHVSLDTAEFDQAAAWCFDELHLRTAYLPAEFYGFGWGHDTPPFRGLAAGTAEYREAYGQCLAAVWDHVRSKGWGERFVLYASDEPAFDDHDPAVAVKVKAQLKALCALAHTAAPGVKVYSSTWRHAAEWDDDLDIWGAGAFGCFPVETMDRLRAAGHTIWFTTDAQLLLDTPYSAIERLNPYYCFAYGAAGYEFWALAWWTYENYDPFRFGWYAYLPHTFTTGGPTTMIRYPNGSGHLTYPGWLVGEPGPLSSIRLEQVREGMEDFEYLAALRDRMAGAQQRGQDISAATALLARVRGLVPIPNAGGTRSTAILPDPDAVFRLRAELAAEILRLGP